MKIINSVVAVLLTTFVLSSCTPKMEFVTSTIAPAATGAINVKKDKNKNYVMNVDVRNLAEPKNLNPSKEAYLVWMEDGTNPVKKLGQLSPQSKSLKASLSATATSEPKRIFITAENDINIQYPDGQVVLTTKQ